MGFSTPSEIEPTESVNITIENIKHVKGNIQIGIYKNANHFLNEGKEFKIIRKKVTGNTLTFTLNSLEKGEYAFAIYHDKNSDKICNKNFFGIPEEPYGFSRVFKSVFSKPKFKNCKIDIGKQKNIRIRLLIP